MAKGKEARGIIKLVSSESDHCYFTEKNRNNSKERISLKKYDPTLRKREELVEIVRYTREKGLLPTLINSGDGHIINVISTAGHDVYDGGAGYTAAKHGAHALTDTLRLELNGEPVKVTDVSPGAVDTEFSLVRFDGDAHKAAKVYEGYTPLTADDVADVITFVATRPWHVNLSQVVMMPRAQASVLRFDRSGRN